MTFNEILSFILSQVYSFFSGHPHNVQYRIPACISGLCAEYRNVGPAFGTGLRTEAGYISDGLYLVLPDVRVIPI